MLTPKIIDKGTRMDCLTSLRKFVSPEIIFGNGSRTLVGRYVKQFLANRVMVVTDKGVIDSGWVDEIESSLKKEGIDYIIYSEVTPNPRTDEVMVGAKLYLDEGCDLIVSIGGGSPMDCAKGIGIVVSNGGDITDYEGVDMVLKPVPPLIFIPTTAGTASDVSQFSIISDQRRMVKIAIVSKTIIPDVALIDPETTTTMDPYLTACTGIDALVHAFEAYVSIASGVLTDSYALNSINKIATYLPLLIEDINNIEHRERVMLASMEAGLAFSNAILGAVHALAHSLGGYLDLPHGECNGMLLPHVVEFNFSSAETRYRDILSQFGIKTGDLAPKEIKRRLFNEIVQLKNRVGIVDQLSTKGVKRSDINQLSIKAVTDACMLTNPRAATVEDVESIYREAL